jgi:hypothetical protein
MWSESERVSFRGLLEDLQSLVGRDLHVTLGVEDRFFGVGFSARLDRVETVPSSSAVVLCFANEVTLDLAPGEQSETWVGSSLCLRLRSGIFVELGI